jgi:type III pantothenate kinase
MDRAPELVTVDCGNSSIDCQRHGDGARLRVDAKALDSAALQAWLREQPLRHAVAVSVAPAALARMRSLLAANAVELRVAGVDTPMPLRLDYATPETLGADRWVGALAAHRLRGRAVVVDCGSATTVNLVDADGTFRGGAIAPGLRAFVAGLAATTPALPAPDLDARPTMPPRTTQAALDAGVLLGYAGLVERLVADALRVSRGPAAVVLTGGNAERLVRHTRLRAELVPDLVHRGLRELATGSAWSS